MREGNDAWFRTAGYGLFIHFGLYAIPAGEWNGVPAPHESEWIMRHLQIPLADYRKLAEEFCPTELNARAIVQKAREWGMKYLVLTAKHHDGFALFDSAVSDYTVMHTPYGKDIVRQFADECHRVGMPFGIYYSQMQDWEHPDGDGNSWDFDPAEKDFSRYFYGKCLPQVRELVTRYGKVDLLWFDTPYTMPEELCRELVNAVKTYQPQCLINSRIGYGLGDYRQMADNSIPTHPYTAQSWECPMTLNRTWGYSRLDQDWKTPEDVLALLTTVRSLGGNVLLNIGPDASGSVPAESVRVLDATGKAIALQSAAFYGTTAAPEFPYVQRWGTITYREEPPTLYFHVRKYPKPPYRFSTVGLVTRVESARLLATGENLKFTQWREVARDEERLSVYLPATPVADGDTVVELRLAAPAEVQTLE